MTHWVSGIEVRYPSSVDCYEFAEGLSRWIVDHYPGCEFEIRLFANCCLAQFSETGPACHFKLAWGGK